MSTFSRVNGGFSPEVKILDVRCFNLVSWRHLLHREEECPFLAVRLSQAGAAEDKHLPSGGFRAEGGARRRSAQHRGNQHISHHKEGGGWMAFDKKLLSSRPWFPRTGGSIDCMHSLRASHFPLFISNKLQRLSRAGEFWKATFSCSMQPSEKCIIVFITAGMAVTSASRGMMSLLNPTFNTGDASLRHVATNALSLLIKWVY